MALVESMVRNELSAGDPVQFAALGLPYRPRAVRALTDPARCGAVLRAFDAGVPAADGVHRLTGGYVVQADVAYALLVVDVDSRKVSLAFFDSTLTYRLAVTSPF